MKHRRWLNLILLGLLLFLPSICHAQWYQGPSGGRGGKPFDFWNGSKGKRDIRHVAVYTLDNTISCIQVQYSDETYQSSPGCVRVATFPYSLGSFNLDSDEYIIGISGEYGDYINSIRFYTSKKTLPVYGRGGGILFGYTATPGQKIAAFTGRSSKYVDAIGVLYVPVE